MTVLFLFPFTIFFLLHRWLRYRDHSNQTISKSHHHGMSIIPFKWCMKTKTWWQEGSGGLVAHYSNFRRRVVFEVSYLYQTAPSGNEWKWKKMAVLCSTAIFFSCQLFYKWVWRIQPRCGCWRLPRLKVHGMMSPPKSNRCMYSCSWLKCRQGFDDSLPWVKCSKCCPLTTSF